MIDEQTNTVQKVIHPQAQVFARQEIKQFATALILRAKTLAYERNDEVVLVNHVKEALTEMREKPRRKRWKELVILIGGSFFGAFVQGFIAELANGNTTLVVVYVMLGFVGLVMALAAILS